MRQHTKELKLGIAGILTLVCLYYGISFLKGNNPFKSRNVYYVTFQNAGGLPTSSPVYADGYSIGTVSDVIYNYQVPGHVVVEISVDRDMRIPKGSSAALESDMLGSIKLNLLLANNPRERLEVGDTIVGTMNAGLMSAAAGLLPEVEQLLPKLDSILARVNALLADPALDHILHNMDNVTANLDKASGKIDKLLANDIPALTQKLNVVAQNTESLTASLDEKSKQLDVDGLMKRVNATLANVENLTNKLNSKDNTVGLLLNDPTLYNNLTETTANAASLLEDLQGHPKRYVHFSLFGKKDK